jgi:hypothetical protein
LNAIFRKFHFARDTCSVVIAGLDLAIHQKQKIWTKNLLLCASRFCRRCSGQQERSEIMYEISVSNEAESTPLLTQ